ncbi:M20 family metallopeptidase [Thalassospiraceae bacterium LMO-JJ14]|nr:M20 family metallopeptidase [Thalassospiraceae bacterium LMO-JJ14]
MNDKASALDGIDDYFDSGRFKTDLARRVAYHTESPEPDKRPELYRYLRDEMTPYLEDFGFTCEIYENPIEGLMPFLVARRHEGDDLPTVMTYGHGDVVRGYDDQWREGLTPWEITEEGDRWYGRGTADNKGQHTINLAAMKQVLETRGKLGFNVIALIETGEEAGSPGLKAFCEQNKDLFKADVFIASDGPRLQPDMPTVFMGSRGVFNFTMTLECRDGGHHSGNWGGLLSNPGVVMAHALATITDARGKLLIEDWRPEPMSNSVRKAISKLEVGGGEGSPEIDPEWGEPGLTPEEKVFGWNTFEIRAFECGNPRNPVNAIPPRAIAHGHIRYVVGTDPHNFLPALRKHLDAHGFQAIDLKAERDYMYATRLDPDHPWAKWAISSIGETSGQEVAVLPNLGGTLPNDCFAEVLGLPTIWVPHSYAGCSQHAPNEHVLAPVCHSALRIMTGLWWDLGDGKTPTGKAA